MKVYYTLENFPVITDSVVTIGNFDGVHAGHLHVIETLVNHKKIGYESIVITFWPHPKTILYPGNKNLKFLTSIEEKIALLSKAGIDHLIVLAFTREIAEMSAMEFVNELLILKIRAKKIILGYDHRFGKDRIGGLDFLKKHNQIFNFLLEEIPKKEIEEIAISSSLIRTFIEEGKVEEAAVLLGRKYELTGIVQEGDKLGRTIGFPTANIKVSPDQKLIPKTGVYAVKVQVNAVYYSGMMNIGYRPTVQGKSLRIEVNIFNFSDNIYGREISVELTSYLRPEEKFQSIEHLKEQLLTDRKNAVKILENA